MTETLGGFGNARLRREQRGMLLRYLGTIYR
jgi:hypothetical protein